MAIHLSASPAWENLSTVYNDLFIDSLAAFIAQVDSGKPTSQLLDSVDHLYNVLKEELDPSISLSCAQGTEWQPPRAFEMCLEQFDKVIQSVESRAIKQHWELVRAAWSEVKALTCDVCQIP
jgi:hypothetical protein